MPYNPKATDTPLMRLPILPAFAAAVLLYGTIAQATVAPHQERVAEALCKADPAWCGQQL